MQPQRALVLVNPVKVCCWNSVLPPELGKLGMLLEGYSHSNRAGITPVLQVLQTTISVFYMFCPQVPRWA